MTSSHLTVAGIHVDIVYKNIKNLHIGVYPPEGRVRVAAPLRLDDDAVRLAVVQRLVWIRRQRQQLKNADRQSLREMVSGESHYVWGNRYRLKVVERRGTAHVETDGDRLILYVSADRDTDQRRQLLEKWYRQQLRAALPALIAEWESKIGVKVARWTIRRMKTKWGSCNPATGHILLNVELAKKHPESLEYVMAHEMVHFLERGHGDRFIALMDRLLPNWRQRRDVLNASPLAYEAWR